VIGKTLAQYEILGLLGSGGMGEVYRARDTNLGREVAVKLLPAELGTDAERRARFEREAQAVAALNHHNVVTLYAFEAANDVLFLVMELVEGRTLEEEIPANGLSQQRLFEMALALTDAVAAAHAKGITHRDLKPQNVMIDGEGRVKVLDFGLAKLLAQPAESVDATIAIDPGATREGFIVGTAAYMSPEQAEGKPVDARSDVFSLGILLYQMITGTRPFNGDTQMSTLTAVLRDEPRPVLELRPDLPRQLSRILSRCLEKDPDRRYESAKGLRYDLEILQRELISGEHERPVVTRAAAPVTAGRPWRPAWIAGIAALLLVAVAGIWLRPGGKTDEGPAHAAEIAPVTAATDPTIVVFPFENLGAPEDAYFAAGITDEIVTSLTHLGGLRILSRTSAQQYDRTGKTMQQIADDLGVDYVLEGSVRWQRSGDKPSRVRVTPQLVDAHTDRQVWAQRYDHTMEEIFRVQTEIADEVVRQLGVTLAAGGATELRATPTEDMTAYHAYLRAADILDSSRFNSQDWLVAVDLLDRAVERDPSFHEAWVKLAKAHAGMCHFDWDRTEERLALAKSAVDRAIALKPGSARSQVARGFYLYWGLKDYEQALNAFQTAAVSLPQDLEIRRAIAYVQRRQGAFAEAVDNLGHVADLSPQDATICYHISETNTILGNYEEGALWAAKAIQLDPNQGNHYVVASWNALLAGWPEQSRMALANDPGQGKVEVEARRFLVAFHLRDYGAALRYAAELPDLSESQYFVISRPLYEGLVYLAMDRRESAQQSLARAEILLSDKLREKPAAGNLVAAHAVVLAGLGRSDEALAEATRSLDLYPGNKDAWIRQWRLYDLAYVQAITGQMDDAIVTLRQLLAAPCDAVSPAMLRNSPAFDSLHGRDDFEALIAVES